MYRTRLFSLARLSIARLSIPVAVALLAISPACDAHGQATRPPEVERETPATALDRAISLLEAEAAEARAHFRMPRLVSDFAERFDGTLDPDDVRRVLRSRVSRDAFVDAYVRWQLLSFNVSLGSFDAEQFEAFVNDSPDLMNNPKATTRTLRFARAMNERGRLGDSDLEAVRERVADLNKQAELVETFRVPADAFWTWVTGQLEEPWRTQWLFAQVVATINAGWPADKARDQFTEHLETTHDGTPVVELLPLPARVKMARRIRLLSARERDYITVLRVTEDDVFAAELQTTGVRAEDADRWVGRLRSARAE